jgi:predicted O-methyltransferase YrrM
MSGYPERYYAFLYLLAKLTRPFLVVELGTREGYGALAFAEGGAQCVVTIDITPDFRTVQHERVEFRLHDSLQVDLDLQGMDILFIDTDQQGVHSGPRALQEYQLWQGLVRPGGLVLFDDVTINESMQQFWQGFQPLRGEKLTLDVHGGCGMGLVLV